MNNIFETETTDALISKINKLTPTTAPHWGKMSAAQMMAHCNVAYEMVYEDKHKAPNAFMKLILKYIVKDTVVGNKPYKRNLRTAPAFLITEEKDFEPEKKRLVDNINKTRELGVGYFLPKESLSFGLLSEAQWNTMFYKHLQHHLTQFGVW